jgi:exodeoxyribonuclease VII small subunit
MEMNLTYEVAYAELQEIAAAIQDESVTVDELAQKLKRASDLIAYCETKLRATEKEVNKIIEKIERGKK